MLLAKKKKTLPGHDKAETTELVKKTEIDKRVDKIKEDVQYIDSVKKWVESKKEPVKICQQRIIENLKFLYDNQEQIKIEKKMNFTEFLNSEFEKSPSFFYETLQAYNTSPELYYEIKDKKALIETSKIEDKKEQKKVLKYIKEHPDTNRKIVKEIRQIGLSEYKEKNESEKTEPNIEADTSPSRTPGNYAIDTLNDFSKKIKEFRNKQKKDKNKKAFMTEIGQYKSMSQGIFLFIKELAKGSHITNDELGQIIDIINKIEEQ